MENKIKELSEIEKDVHELFEGINEILIKVKVNGKNRSQINFNILSILTNGYQLGKSNVDLQEWIYKYSTYSQKITYKN